MAFAEMNLYRDSDTSSIEKFLAPATNEDDKNSGFDKIIFIENKNQHEKAVAYYAESTTGSYFFETDGSVSIVLPLDHEAGLDEEIPRWAFKETLENAQKIHIKPNKETATKFNYIIGNDPKDYIQNLKAYKELTFDEVYANVSLDY